MIQDLLALDHELFLQLNGHHTLILDRLMELISGKFTWIPLYAFFLYLIFKQWSLRGLLIAIPTIAILIAFSDMGSVYLFKERFMRLRPCHVPELQGLVHIVNDHCGGKFGFISSHASNHFAIAFFLLGMLKHITNWGRVFILFWALLVGYSRIYLGVHYPGDVLAGAVFGAGVGVSVALLYRYLHQMSNRSTTADL